METGYEVGSASLIAFADGTSSLYYSTGGGMLGSGDYLPVAQASLAMVEQAELLRLSFSAISDYPLPEVGQVRFILLTYAGPVSAEAREADLNAGVNPLASLYHEAQELLTQLRLSAEKKRR
jgi:hypothetical protein